MSGAGSIMSTGSGGGLGAQAATRDTGAIRQKAGHLEQLNGRVRVQVQELENFRNRVTGYYDERIEKEPQVNVPQEHKTDLDELQYQLHQMEAGLDMLENHIREIQAI